MILSNKTVRKFIKGALYFSEERGYLTPFRYTKAQLDFMADESYDYGWRARAKFSGGIRMELVTDSKNLSFEYKASDIHERSNTIDLFVDGVLYSVYKIEDKLKGKVHFSMPEGSKKITIYFPNESKLDIKRFTIDGKYKAIKDKGENVLIIGDSITQGAGPEIASASYLHSLTRKTGYNILGQGVGGYRYEARDLMKLEGFEPDKIIVFLGTNYCGKECINTCGYDYKTGVEDFYKRLSELYPNTKILSITPLWRNNNVNMERFKWCIDTIKEECAKYSNISVADGFDLVPNVDECFSDKVHPNAYGSELLATNLYNFIKKIKF